MATKTKPSPLDLAKSVSGTKKPFKTWLDDLDAATRNSIVEAAREIHAGRLINKVAIVDAWRKAGIEVTYNRLNGLLRKIKEGAI